jgi:hypothetical protein
MRRSGHHHRHSCESLRNEASLHAASHSCASRDASRAAAPPQVLPDCAGGCQERQACGHPSRRRQQFGGVTHRAVAVDQPRASGATALRLTENRGVLVLDGYRPAGQPQVEISPPSWEFLTEMHFGRNTVLSRGPILPCVCVYSLHFGSANSQRTSQLSAPPPSRYSGRATLHHARLPRDSRIPVAGRG